MAFLVVLDELSSEQRPAVVLHDVIGLEFAAGPGCSDVAARQHASRGRRRLTRLTRARDQPPNSPGPCSASWPRPTHRRRGNRPKIGQVSALSDRRRLTLSDDRGWTSSIHTVPAGLLPPDPWADLSVEAIEQDVRNVVLPDDAEQTGDEHPWAVLTARIRALVSRPRPSASGTSRTR